MSQLIFSREALRDLTRLSDFLATKDKAVARRAGVTIIASLEAMMKSPEAYRPVQDRPTERELVIKFGATGYLARYRYERGGDVYVLRVWHQLESRE